MKKLLLLGILLLTLQFSFAQKHSKAKVLLNNRPLQELAQCGIELDHGYLRKGVSFESDFSEEELQAIKNAGFEVQIIVDDVAAWYQQRAQNQAPVDQSRAVTCAEEVPEYPVPNGFTLGSMGGFYTYSEYLAALDSMAARYPDLITQKDTIPGYTTHDGRPIYWVRISDNPTVDEAEPEVLYTAVHHAREPGSLSQLLFYMFHILENYATDSLVKGIVDNSEMYFIPMVNPDGYVFNEQNSPNGGGMFRKNRRNNQDGTFGVDLNRNYGFEWGFDNDGSSPNSNSETYRGPSAFSEPETQAVKAFSEAHTFQLALNYHTFGNLFIYPWGYTASLFTPDSALFANYGALMTQFNDYRAGTGDQTVGYVTNGDSDDWMYGEQTTKNKIMSFTPECGTVDDGFWPVPSRIIPICEENVYPNLLLPQFAMTYAQLEETSPKLLGNSSQLKFNVKRLGLAAPSNYTVSVSTTNPAIQLSSATFSTPNLNVLDEYLDSIPFTVVTPLALGAEIEFDATIDLGYYTQHYTITKIVGEKTLVIADNFDNANAWSNGSDWAVTTENFVSPSSSITDSPFGNYFSNSYSQLILNDNLDLRQAVAAEAEFWANWSLETRYDYAFVAAKDVVTNEQFILCGAHSSAGNSNQLLNEPIYDGFTNGWLKETVDLTPVLGRLVQFQINLVSDAFVEFDGFYVDDFEVNAVLDTSIQVIDGIQDVEMAQYRVYPNPASSSVTIAALSATLKHAQLVDLQGRILLSLPLIQSQTIIDLQSFQPGMYTLLVTLENGDVFPRKLVISQ